MSDRDTDIDALKSFFVKEFLDGDEKGLDASTNLVSAGLINSQAIVKLTTFIIERWGVRIPFKQMTPQNLSSLGAIADLVARVRG